jgi:GDPmannose 4,6-dehydratase
VAIKTALITGITGQDGSYLAELLLVRGYKVVGTTRDARRASADLAAGLSGKVELLEWNMLDERQMAELLALCRPQELYNFAACSFGSGMYDDPAEIGEVNGLAVTRILEAIRKTDRGIRFCQASSREIFGAESESPQSEQTPANPRSPYGAAKLYADSMVRIYRRHYGLFSCSAILFNHESPRRGLDFVTRKIAHEAARIKLGLASQLRLGNLEARRDWGFAGDYVRGMWLMLQQPHVDDYVLASGETHSVRELCECAFGYLGLDYKNYVQEDAAAYRPSEPTLLVGNISKARHALGWEPTVGFRELVNMMVEAELQVLSEKLRVIEAENSVQES